jgi:hypothetical protein
VDWPKYSCRVVEVVERLIELKRAGLPIKNSYAQLRAMIRYSRNPGASRGSIQSHAAHEHRELLRAALFHLQLEVNADITNCADCPVGNIKSASRGIWL